MKSMTCRNCGAGLEQDRIDTSLRIVTCSHCGSLHEVPGLAPEAASDNRSNRQAAGPKPHRQKVALPEKYQVYHGSNSMEIKWSTGGLFHGLVLTLMAAGVGFMAYDAGEPALLIGSVVLLYVAAAKTINKKIIRIDNARLKITEGPLPTIGKRKRDGSEVVQLFASEYQTKTQVGNDSDRRITTQTFYKLSANTSAGRRITLINNLRDPLQALWLEQEMEKLLGITDMPMDGEYRP